MDDRSVSAAMSKWAGAAGIAFGVLFVAGLGISSSGLPHYDASDQKWVSWFQDSGHRASQIIGMFLMVAAALLLIVFFVTLLRRAVAAGGSQNAAVVAGVAGTVVAGAVAIGAVIHSGISAAVAFAPHNFPVPSADVTRSLDNLAFGVLAVSAGWAAVIFVGASSRALRNTSLIPGWLIAAGYVAAVLLIGSFGFFPLFLLPLWAIVAGIALVTGRVVPEPQRLP